MLQTWFEFIRIKAPDWIWLIKNRFALNRTQNVFRISSKTDFGIACIRPDWIIFWGFLQGSWLTKKLLLNYINLFMKNPGESLRLELFRANSKNVFNLIRWKAVEHQFETLIWTKFSIRIQPDLSKIRMIWTEFWIRIILTSDSDRKLTSNSFVLKSQIESDSLKNKF